MLLCETRTPISSSIDLSDCTSGQLLNRLEAAGMLHIRYYEPGTGRFNRLDPFSGNTQKPLSLHKYLYAEANSVMRVDPSGQFAITLGLTNTSILLSSLNSLFAVAPRRPPGANPFAQTSTGPSGPIPKPGWWSLVPIVGSGWEVLYNFQEGNIGLGVIWTAIAVSDVFLVKALATSVLRALGKVAASEGAEVVFTRVPGQAIPKIAESGTYIARTEGAVYGMASANASIWRTLPSKATGSGIVTWTGQAAKLFARHPVAGWYSGLKRVLGQFKSIQPGNIKMVGFTRSGNQIVVWSATIVPGGTLQTVQANARVVARITGLEYGLPRAVEGAMEWLLN